MFLPKHNYFQKQSHWGPGHWSFCWESEVILHYKWEIKDSWGAVGGQDWAQAWLERKASLLGMLSCPSGIQRLSQKEILVTSMPKWLVELWCLLNELMCEKFLEECQAKSRWSINVVMMINIITQNLHGASIEWVPGTYILCSLKMICWGITRRETTTLFKLEFWMGWVSHAQGRRRPKSALLY